MMPLPSWTPATVALPLWGQIVVGIDERGDYHLIVNVAGSIHDYRSGRRLLGVTQWTPIPQPPESDQ